MELTVRPEPQAPPSTEDLLREIAEVLGRELQDDMPVPQLPLDPERQKRAYDLLFEEMAAGRVCAQEFVAIILGWAKQANDGQLPPLGHISMPHIPFGTKLYLRGILPAEDYYAKPHVQLGGYVRRK